MSKKVVIQGQEVLFYTWHYGKEYMWLKDIDGTHYMVRVDEQGKPIFA